MSTSPFIRPDGRVTLAAPTNTRLEVCVPTRSPLVWIRDQQRKLECQARETPASSLSVSHHVWGGAT